MDRARELTVALGERSYPVILSEGGYAGLGDALRPLVRARRVVLVSEPRTARWAAEAAEALEAAGFAVAPFAIEVDEASKNLSTWARCVDRLLEVGLDRRTPVAAVGGGVLGDVVGFAAATVLRGVPFVQIPTTLLAMVDSSVGGKTGVNHPRGKNLVGAFHQPVLVFAALGALATLPEAERVAGLGEVVKTAVLGDAALLERLERDAEALRAGDPEVLAEVIASCIRIKAAVVAEDEREAGRRAVLNLGHTVGHALEATSGFGRLRHGEAVALGLLAESRWAVRAGHCEEPDLPARTARLLERLGLPTIAPKSDPVALLAALRVDKKAVGGKLTLPVPARAGRAILVEVADTVLAELLRELE